MNSHNKVHYIIILVLSVLFLIIGNRIASRGVALVDDIYSPAFYRGVILEVTDRVEAHPGEWFASINIYFTARITDGDRRGEIVAAQQHQSAIFAVNEREVETGDRIILTHNEFSGQFSFVNYIRINQIIILGAIFLVLVVVFGRTKGFNGIMSLGFSCISVFLVFIPAILSGRNIYATVILVSIYSIVSTLLLVIGANKKALSAILGCLGGLVFAGVLMVVMDNLLGLTGAINREAEALLVLPTATLLDLRALIFAGVIFGAVGAIMDVAMSIASALWEVREAGGVSDFKSLVKSGITIGQDTLGTMLNTLILAYIGSSLSIILLIIANTTSYVDLLNMEMIIVEFLRALIGSFGMLLTIPLTAVICGWLFSARKDDTSSNYPNDDYYEKLIARQKRETRGRG